MRDREVGIIGADRAGCFYLDNSEADWFHFHPLFILQRRRGRIAAASPELISRT
jgi:hypothetical protein